MSALQLAVPAADPLLDALRDGLPDGASVLDPAHISFGYPWLAPEDALAVVDDVAAALADADPIEVTLTGPHRFPPDRQGRVVLHLRPEPAEPIVALGERIAAASGRPVGDFTPHCSLVRLPDGTDPAPFASAVAPHLPLAARLDRVELHVQASGGWRHARTMRLGRAPDDRRDARAPDDSAEPGTHAPDDARAGDAPA